MYRIYGPGQTCVDAVAGDLFLTQAGGVVRAGIRGFERVRVPKEFCWANHGCIALTGGRRAEVAQETARGTVVTPVADLDAITYAVVHVEMDDVQRTDVVIFARWSIGLGYGFLQIPADAFNALTGLELGLNINNRMVCSTQACRALERAGYIPSRSPSAVTPAHLAQDFSVVLPPALSNRKRKP
jgi:hypothetical protein